MTEFHDRVMEAHGGVERWQSVRAIDARLNLFGRLLELKGYPGHRQPTISIDPARPFAQIRNLDGDPDDRWFFSADQVWIEDHAGNTIARRSDPRASFSGHERTTPWDQLHLLYFFGYAMWNYLTQPFLFLQPGFDFRELEHHVEDGEVWRVIEITFPPSIPAHTRTQHFYFDAQGILRRIDYTTDILGGVGAHYCYDHKTFDGILFPTLRRVVRRTAEGAKLSGPTSFVIDYIDIAIKRA